MATIRKDKSIYFNDVNLLPCPGSVKSRSEISRQLDRIIISPMTSVVGPTFAREATRLGLTVCIPRFLTFKRQLEILNAVDEEDKDKIFASIGLDAGMGEITAFQDYGARNWLLDIASGYLPQIETFCNDFSKLVTKDSINKFMIGNVNTYEGVSYLRDATKSINYKELFIRVGIGNGSGCATSDMTGVGRGQITELMELSLFLSQRGLYLCSDGGINKPGFAVKAFAAGASHVLMGGYFACAEEAETNLSGDGTYWGLASEKQQKLTGSAKKHSEGKVYEVKDRKPLKDIVEELWGGISSGISYTGFNSLNGLIGNGHFEIKQNSLPPKTRY